MTVVTKENSNNNSPEKESKPSKETRARVVRVDSDTGKPLARRVMFEGLEADARKYVENNNPRPHIEEGNVLPPDVIVQVMNGDKVKSSHQFHADNGWSDYKEDESE